MATISAAMVKELRDKTGAGMMDCKRALVETDGDMETAIDELRKSGIAKAEKKAGRAVKEGKIIALIDGGKAVMVEVLCETDFVGTNEKFINFVNGVAERAIAIEVDGCISEQVQANENEVLTSMIATIGENMQLRRAVRWETTGTLASYMHMGGRIGVLVDVEGEADETFLNELCMHIAAFNPAYIAPCDIPEDVVAREKEVAAGMVAGKPENMIEKIVMGKINKWYKETCLVNQAWIKDDKSSLSKLKPNLKVKRFLRWEMGAAI
jgi:elongation factor Ts